MAEFRIKGGVLQAQSLVLDTGVVVVAGEGSINLASETMDLSFKGRPKKFRLVRVAAPITVGGSLRAPRFGVDNGAAAAQTGVGLALGALLTPIAAILPFVDPGLGKDANCLGLIQEAQVGRAPVTAGRGESPACSQGLTPSCKPTRPGIRSRPRKPGAGRPGKKGRAG